MASCQVGVVVLLERALGGEGGLALLPGAGSVPPQVPWGPGSCLMMVVVLL